MHAYKNDTQVYYLGLQVLLNLWNIDFQNLFQDLCSTGLTELVQTSFVKDNRFNLSLSELSK